MVHLFSQVSDLNHLFLFQEVNTTISFDTPIKLKRHIFFLYIVKGIMSKNLFKI